MGDTKVGIALSALLTNIAVDVSDLKGFLKQVGAGVALYLEIGGDLCHGGDGTNFSAILTVTPGGMVLTVGVDADSKHDDEKTQSHQSVRQNEEVITCQQGSAIDVSKGSQREQICQQQQPGSATLAGGDLGVNNGNEVMLKEVMIEGLLSIQAGENPRVIEEKLKSFLSPAQREAFSEGNNEGGE